MKKYLIIAVSIVSTFSFLYSCNKTQDNTKCISYSSAQVTKVSGPNTALINQQITVTISYYLTNGCGHFEAVETTSVNNTTTFNIKAKYEGCICTDNLIGGETNYTFKADKAGSYYLKFLQPDKTYLVDTITVN